jgi:RNA polymerase sigma factor (sigma-70 family)
LATQSDERLLGLVREGHERAFEALVNRYRRPLLNYCRRLPLPEARAEDVLQQALLKTWIALHQGADVRDIKAWLYRVVHNTAVNAVRDAAHDRERLADPTLRADTGQADLERGLVLREALAEVAALPSLQREVIVRTAVGGHSHEQVASDLGITDGAVRGLLYRARATLRTAVTALTPPPLLTWLAGRAEQGGPAPERLGELAAGGSAAGLGGLLV